MTDSVGLLVIADTTVDLRKLITLTRLRLVFGWGFAVARADSERALYVDEEGHAWSGDGPFRPDAEAAAADMVPTEQLSTWR